MANGGHGGAAQSVTERRTKMPGIRMFARAIGPVALATFLAAQPGRAQELPPVAHLDTCFLGIPAEVVQTRGADCGYVTVPQSRTGGDGEVGLAFMRLNAQTPSDAAPLFMLAGGPGQAQTGDPAVLQLFRPELLGPILETRDVVLMEQRGTLRSRPHLDCPGFWTVQREGVEQGLDEEAGRALLEERLSACISRHATNGVDLASYNNLENAADVNDMRVALGYERIVFYGASYGTELAQHVMREYPDSLEAVVLDGTASLASTDWSARQARYAQWGIDNLTDLCAADADCAANYDIPALLDGALALFEDGPITTTYAPPDQPDLALELELTEESFASYAHSLQLSKFSVMVFPALLNAYVTEGRERLAGDMAGHTGGQLLGDPAAQDAAMSILMHAAMICSDDPPRSLDDIETNGTGRYERMFARDSAALYVELCAILDLPQLPARSDDLATADVPTLVLSGGLDVQTPHFVAQEVVDALPHATHVIFPAGFHVQVANINLCAIAIMRDFVLGSGASPDLTCVAEVEPLPFMLPDFTMPKGD